MKRSRALGRSRNGGGFQSGPRRREPGDRNPIRRAGDVVETGLVEEADRRRGSPPCSPQIPTLSFGLGRAAATRARSRRARPRRPRRSMRTGPRAGCPPPGNAAGTIRCRRASTRRSSASGRSCRTRRSPPRVRSRRPAARRAEFRSSFRPDRDRGARVRERPPRATRSIMSRSSVNSASAPTSGIMISGIGRTPLSRDVDRRLEESPAPAFRRSRGASGPDGSRGDRASDSPPKAPSTFPLRTSIGDAHLLRGRGERLRLARAGIRGAADRAAGS